MDTGAPATLGRPNRSGESAVAVKMRFAGSWRLGRGDVLKLVTYSTGNGAPKVGHIEDGEIHALGGGSLLEYIEHGRDADRRPEGEVVALEEARLHPPMARPG